MDREGKSNRGSRPPEQQDVFLKWGNRKRLRCVKIRVKDDANEKTIIRVDRRVIRADEDSSLALRPSAGLRTNSSQRVLRNSDPSMKALNGNAKQHQDLPSPDKAEKPHPAKHVGNSRNGGSGSSETEIRASNNNSNGRSGDSNNNNHNNVFQQNQFASKEVLAWPKIIIALSSKEKEEDFMAIKGSKLPHRPKKRPKIVQRTLNLVSPGSWLCELTQERYEVREKKVSKKRPRGLKAMGNADSDSD